MKLLSYNDLKSRGIPFSKVEIWRKEKAGKFPKRITLSYKHVAWREDHIDKWLADKIRESEAMQ